MNKMLSGETGYETLSVIAEADKFNRWMYETIKPYLKGQVLEIGSGLGNISEFVIEDGYSLTLSDYNNDYCNYLKEHFSTSKNVQDVINIDLQLPGFQEYYHALKEKFDTIFLLNVIEHLKDDSLALQNCMHLLKKNGSLIILTPAYQWLYCRFDKELGHFRRYTKTTLTNLLKKEGFSVKKKTYFNLLGIAGWLFFGKILNKKLIGQNEMSAYNRLVGLAKWLDRTIMNRAGLSVIVVGIKN